MKRIKDVLPYGGDVSLFALLAYYAPWGTAMNAGRLDLLYLSHSGNKVCGPIFDILTDDGATEMTSTQFSTLARSIADLYSNKWQRLWDVRNADYEPLENYNMTEHGEDKTRGNSTTKTDGLQTTVSDSQSESSAEATDNRGRYGFASAAPVDTDAAGTQSGSNGKTHGEGTVTDDTTVTVEEGRGTEHDLTRNGNIGIRSSQELLTQEIELWQWQFFETVFNDIDKVIALSVY